MRLDKIKLAGFKSFVDPTTINFPSNLTGIIGPNGCGKSNTIDAVRWVMGESSAKNLRGDSMTDVIFNGSIGRKPVGQASIELVFDNSAGKLGGQYAQYAEISIKRQVSRDGQSGYFLNGTRCRRKDITDIFLGTGLGPRSYAIIEQGMISRLIEAKPDELRIFIEEAAGISKYKERRRETETRIKSTRDNIDRINDLRDELEKRIGTLQRQAKAAEKYKELKEEERLVKAQLLALRWRTFDSEASEQERRISHQEIELEAQLAELRANEAAMERQREEQIEVNERFNEIQGAFYAVGAEIARLEQAIHHARESRLQHERELRETNRTWEEAQGHQTADNERIEQLTRTLDGDESALVELKERAKFSTALLAESESEMHLWQQAWDEFNQRASAQLRAAEVERARSGHLEQSLTQLRERHARMASELTTFDTQHLESGLVALRETLGECQRLVTGADEELEQIRQQLHESKERIQQLNHVQREQQGRAQQRREQYASLEALQAEALGKNANKVNQWLTQVGLHSTARLAQEMTVDKGWERAVETVLGFRLESLCVESLDSIGEQIGTLRQGALTFLERSTEAAVTVPKDALVHKVASAWPVAELLAGVTAVDTLSDALTRRLTLASHESVVTRDGLWLGRHWLRVAQSANEESGLLVREQLIKGLAAEMAQDREVLAVSEEQLHHACLSVQTLEESRERVALKRNEVSRRQAELQAQISGKQARLESVRARQERVNNDIGEIDRQMERDTHEAAAARARLHAALAATEGHGMQREALIQQRDTHRLRLEESRKQARADQEQAHTIELRCQAMSTQLRATQENLARIQRQLAHLEKRREELRDSLLGGDEPIVFMQEQLEAQLTKRLEVEQRLAEARGDVERVDQQIRATNGQRHQIEQRVQQLRSDLDRLRMGWQESKARSQTLLEQIVEASYQVERLLLEMPTEASEPLWSEQVENIARAIQRLGAINLAAIEEFAEQSERKQYLDAQLSDLTDALTTLESAIQKIDKETRTRFKDTFDKVNAGLQSKFPRLFGGGYAYLELTGEDLLETGVTVMARPPGKRNSTIHLLSGGEKALTAVAMVFAIFELNPSPFCLLDEVDAPLDDANVGRFCEVVKEMAEQVQFIFITHNKVTMEMAQQLCGVTMHEPGVSRLVAVDIDQAVELAAAS